MGVMCCQTKKFFLFSAVFKTTLDTTGCGDIFFSSFVYFYLQEKFNLKKFLSYHTWQQVYMDLIKEIRILLKIIFFRQHNQF